MVIMAF
jgi:hypothetical protein